VRTDVGTFLAIGDGIMDEPNAINDARLPSARIPSTLLARLKAAVGDRGYATLVRRALEREIRRIEARNSVRTSAK